MARASRLWEGGEYYYGVGLKKNKKEKKDTKGIRIDRGGCGGASLFRIGSIIICNIYRFKGKKID